MSDVIEFPGKNAQKNDPLENAGKNAPQNEGGAAKCCVTGGLAMMAQIERLSGQLPDGRTISVWVAKPLIGTAAAFLLPGTGVS